jgi:hypothetical protein
MGDDGIAVLIDLSIRGEDVYKYSVSVDELEGVQALHYNRYVPTMHPFIAEKYDWPPEDPWNTRGTPKERSTMTINSLRETAPLIRVPPHV